MSHTKNIQKYIAVHINFMACLKMNIFQIIFACVFTYIFAAPQQPDIKNDNAAEIPDHYEKHPDGNQLHTTVHAPEINHGMIHDVTQDVAHNEAHDVGHNVAHDVGHAQATANPDASPDTTVTNYVEGFPVTTPQLDIRDITEATMQQPLSTKLYTIVALPIKRFIALPKVKIVLRNIGTCVVNGAMEIISHFFPTPLMPLIASAAGMIIPFEPIVLLKERMPVASYRRAIKTAVNSFMDTFDKYRVEDQYDDPYMTRRFNRRFMNNDNIGKIKRAKDT